jgi:histidyl-tRNA synthetase
LIKSIRGFNDILPEEVSLWQYMENKARQVFDEFCYSEIRTPIMENSELFNRSIGEDTDIVEKEMYSVIDRKDRTLALRPEGTASVVRAYIEHGMQSARPVLRLFYFGPMFRYERAQRGRSRQFHQIGAEMIGSSEALADAEMIMVLWEILSRCGLEDKELKLNSLGCPQCRPKYKSELSEYLEGFRYELCPDCQRRLDRNPLRVLDCKVEGCRKIVAGTPRTVDFLCPECKGHFDEVKRGLSDIDIPYTLDAGLVRGLDYYTRTAFEVVSRGLGAQDAVAGGGRYDKLISELGGPQNPAIGFALGCERLIILMKENEIQPEPLSKIYICHIGARARREAFVIARDLRSEGFNVEIFYEERSLKSQLKQANKTGASIALIIGEDEIEQEIVHVRDLNRSSQEKLAREALAPYLKKIITD